MKTYLAQFNPKIGDLTGNLDMLKQAVAENNAADLIVFPELFLTGFPPKDLLYRGDFLRAVRRATKDVLVVSKTNPKPVIMVGTPWQEEGTLYNSVLVIKDGKILGVQHKNTLSPYRLFNEEHYFARGKKRILIQLGQHVLGIALGLELNLGLAKTLKKRGASIIINPTAIPFQIGEHNRQIEELRSIAVESGLPIIRVNQVGGNDELIFAGSSLAISPAGRICAKGSDFITENLIFTLDGQNLDEPAVSDDETEQIYQALTLGLRDYVRKNGMKRVIIGLSGGLDSAVAAVIAVNALGSENVWGITQPGPYSMESSVPDAEALANNLGIDFDILPIGELYNNMLSTLAQYFADTEMNVAEENIQARLRGNILMALSNKLGGMVLTNSNKSELAIGYCTLYGDMSGGLAVIADVYKTMVYQLAYYINREEEVIPWNTIEKPPSAELRPDQRDDESLPPYDLLDGVIKAYLDESLTPQEIIAEGYDQELVDWVTRTIDNNEYKRRQAALILRVTTPILGYEREMPLTAQKRFKG